MSINLSKFLCRDGKTVSVNPDHVTHIEKQDEESTLIHINNFTNPICVNEKFQDVSDALMRDNVSYARHDSVIRTLDADSGA